MNGIASIWLVVSLWSASEKIIVRSLENKVSVVRVIVAIFMVNQRLVWSVTDVRDSSG